MKQTYLSCVVVGLFGLVLVGCPTSDDIDLNKDAGLGQHDIVLSVDGGTDFGPVPTDLGPPPDLTPPPVCTTNADCTGSFSDLGPCEQEVCDTLSGECAREPQLEGLGD